MKTATANRAKRLVHDESSRFFDLSLDMLCIAGMDGYFKQVNPAWEATLGFTAEEMLGRPFIDFIHPDDVDATNEKYATQIEEDKDVVQFENRYRCKDGTYKWLLWNARTVAHEQRIYAVARDITYRHLTEEALAEKAVELERSNAELEDFTHVVSHDLKEPLRGIEGFSSFLAEDYADKLDERGQRYVAVLRESAIRMRDLIDDLLQLSRIGRTRPQLEAVDFGSLLADVREVMEFTLRERGVELRIACGSPTIVCDPVRIKQVFENLISNAVKYTDKPTPEIEVGCKQDDRSYILHVRDNGPGIEKQYQEKIFRIFQRLVLREEHEGTGVGLTICKKIVEAHGGRIWVESDGVGRGSTFVFTIPKSLRAHGGKETGNGSSGARSHSAGGGQPARHRDNGKGAGKGPGSQQDDGGAGRPGSA
jgi:PAS domain S-box-containing protein